MTLTTHRYTRFDHFKVFEGHVSALIFVDNSFYVYCDCMNKPAFGLLEWHRRNRRKNKK